VPRRDPWVYIGLVAFFALLFVALFGERLAPHESIYFVIEHNRDPRPYDPGLVFPFGSDVLGRDLISLVLAGAGATLLIVVLAGLARVLAGLIVAALAGWWRPTRTLTDASAELVAAVPATVVALVVVKVFVKGDASFLVFVGALLLTGWAGPYRILRSELDRLSRMGFTESASAMGAGRMRIFVSHHLPHLVPLLAVNATQQTVASLVAMAELGVIGVFVGASRFINIQESLSFVSGGQVNMAFISEPPEWGGLLAGARGIDSLWATRFLFLVPGIAFALAAVAIAAVGVGLARHYARRNLLQDLRGRGARVIALACAAMVIAALLMPDRYAAAHSWADDARAATRPVTDIAAAMTDAGLKPMGGSYEVTRDVEQIAKVAPASVRVGDVEVHETNQGPVDVRAVLYADSGGATIDAPLVFAGWGISPADYPRQPQQIFGVDFGGAVESFPDDYRTVDVRGKVVVLLRYNGLLTGRGTANGPDVETHIKNAIKRGAAAVLLVDPLLPRLPRVTTGNTQNTYQRVEQQSPITRVAGVPVIVMSPSVADRLLVPFGISTTDIYASVGAGVTVGTIFVSPTWIPTDSRYAEASMARDLGTRARVEVDAAEVRAHVRSVIAESVAPASQARIVVWAVLHPSSVGDREPIEAMVAAARAIAGRSTPLIFVAFDPSVDAAGNARMVADVVRARTIGLVIVLDDLVGSALQFRTPFGDLVPAFDRYADKAGVPHLLTRGTVSRDSELWTWPGIAPFIDDRSIVVSGAGAAGDLRAATAALLAYVAGRAALGAEELPR